MKIIGAAAYRQFQPFSDGPYRCRGQTEAGFDSTILRLDSDSGLTGWGEMAPLGTFYSEAFAAGVRAAMPELLPKLLGADPRQLDKINQLMDQAFFGQPYLKAPLDMACWDLAGQAAGLPLAELTGGRFGETVWLYRSVSQDTPERMVETARRHIEAGYRRLQVKVGGDPLEDATRMQAVRAVVPEDVLLLADANGAWQLDAALRFAMALGDMDYYLEQPCMAMADNARLAANLRQPLILDESIACLGDLLEAHHLGIMSGVTLKISRIGGITKTKRLRDVAVELGLRVTIEDTGGSDIDSAATAHLMLSTPEGSRFHTVDFMNWVTVSNARGMPPCEAGQMAAPTRPGLGLQARREILGEPFFEIG